MISFLGFGLALTGGFALLNRISRLRRFPSGSRQGRYFLVFLDSPVERGGSLESSNSLLSFLVDLGLIWDKVWITCCWYSSMYLA